MKHPILKTLAAATPLVLSASTLTAQTVSKDGGARTTLSGQSYRNWSDANNWTSGTPNPLIAVINDGLVFFDVTDLANGSKFYVGSADYTVTGVELNGGTLQMNDSRANIRIGERSTASVVQTGGTFYLHSGELEIGSRTNGNTPGNGLYSISAGTLSSTGGAYPGGRIQLNRRPGDAYPSVAELRISGTATVDLGVTEETTQGDGTLATPSLLFGANDASGTGDAVLTVIGPDATIRLDSLWMVSAASTLRYRFDRTGVSTINVTGNYSAAQADATVLLSTGMLDVDFSGTEAPETGATFDLIKADRIASDGEFVLNPDDAANWGLTIEGTGVMGDGSQDVLRLTFLGGALPAARLVARWTFDADGDIQPDTSGNGNDAIRYEGANWVFDPVRASGVMDFNGNDAFLEAAASESLAIAGDMTLAAWVLPTDYTTDEDGAPSRGILARTEGNQPSPFDLYLQAGSGKASFLAGAPGAFGSAASLTGVAAGQWHHVAVTLKNGQATFYYDGMPDGTGMITNALADSMAPLTIGNRTDFVTDFLGRMDDVVIFDGALTQSGIQEIMAGDFRQFIRDLAITNIRYDAAGPAVTLTFDSAPGATYAVEYSTSLSAAGQPGGWTELNDGVASHGSSTTYTDTDAAGTASRVYYRIRLVP